MSRASLSIFFLEVAFDMGPRTLAPDAVQSAIAYRTRDRPQRRCRMVLWPWPSPRTAEPLAITCVCSDEVRFPQNLCQR
jgi:hypothetical protein